MDGQETNADLEQALPVIRLAMIGGVVAFGAGAWAVPVTTGAAIAPELTAGHESLVWGGLSLLFLALFTGVAGLRWRWVAEDDASSKRSLNVMGWAVAEAGGLVGCVYLLLIGDPAFFGVGLALLVLTTFVLLPIPSGTTE